MITSYEIKKLSLLSSAIGRAELEAMLPNAPQYDIEHMVRKRAAQGLGLAEWLSSMEPEYGGKVLDIINHISLVEARQSPQRAIRETAEQLRVVTGEE